MAHSREYLSWALVEAMAYSEKNYASKKALREAHAAGFPIMVFQPGPFGPDVSDGTCILEGPHYPKAHTWYASVTVRNGVVVPGSKIR